MLNIKVMVAVCVGCVSAIALADTSANFDVYGRPVVRQDVQETYALETYRTADPFDPLPQLWVPIRPADSSARAAERVAFDATEFYYSGAPFDPLPQFWERRSAASPEIAQAGSNRNGVKD